jgi:AhpD family alkylhydroperoxidase
MSQRISYMQQSPELFKKFIDFNNLVKQGAIEEPIRDLVAIRASQMNGCGFCLDMHVKQARIHGERELRVHHLALARVHPLCASRACGACMD